jgi:hypothetical protein
MGNGSSQHIKDFEAARRALQATPKTVIMDTENDAKIYAESIREPDTFVEVIKCDDKFAITKHLMPPLWLGVYELHSATIVAWFQQWARMNGYSTSIYKNIIAVGKVHSSSLSPGIPKWYNHRALRAL